MKAVAPAVAIFFSLSALPGPAAELPAVCEADEEMCQDDAGTGADAPDVPELAPHLQIALPYEGKLLAIPTWPFEMESPGFDQHDWYKVTLKAHRKITVRFQLVELLTPANINGQGAYDQIRLELRTPNGVLALTIQSRGFHPQEFYTITAERGEWLVHATTVEVGAKYRFEILQEEASHPHAIRVGNGWVALGFSIGEEGGSVVLRTTTVLDWVEDVPGVILQQKLSGSPLVLGLRTQSLFTAQSPSGSAAAGGAEADAFTPLALNFPTWEISAWAPHKQPGPFYHVLTGVASSAYLLIEAFPTGDVTFFEPTQGETVALRQSDFDGAVRIRTSAGHVSQDLSAQLEVKHLLVGRYFCGSDFGVPTPKECHIIRPDGSEAAHVFGEPGRWTFTRDSEAAVNLDRFVLLASDVGLPEDDDAGPPKGKKHLN